MKILQFVYHVLERCSIIPTNTEQQEAEEAFEQGFHGIPDPKRRAKMSPEKLAILLSQQQAGSPAHILVEHELNLRIALIQSQATSRAGWIGLLGALLGAALGFFLSTLFPKEVKQELPGQVPRCECGIPVQQPATKPRPSVSSPVGQGDENADTRRSTNKMQQK
jgi:hypothetical protein